MEALGSWSAKFALGSRLGMIRAENKVYGTPLSLLIEKPSLSGEKLGFSPEKLGFSQKN